MSENVKTKDGQRANGQIKEDWPIGFDYPHLKWYPSEINTINNHRKNADNLVMPPAVVRKAPWRG